MSEKAISKHLTNIEKQFSTNSPVLQQATKIFHELDQMEFELGLIDNEETTARKSSWWPIVSLISNNAVTKNNFLFQFLSGGSQSEAFQSTNHKFTVLQHTPQATPATLPGSALDVDHRLPFYQISRKIEQCKTGEGNKINSYLELKTINSARLKGRLFIDTPDFNSVAGNQVNTLLTQHIIGMSDLVMIFTSVFDAEPSSLQALIADIQAHQDANKFVYLIDLTDIVLTPERAHSSISSWQRKLADLGLHTGQFIVLSNSSADGQNRAFTEIEQRLANIENDRSYRVLDTLERSIRDIGDVIIPEVRSAIVTWKERCNFSTLIILGLIITLMLFGEISMGIVDLLLDPIIGPISLVALILFLTPIHIMMSKSYAKSFIRQLDDRQQALLLTESLSGLFIKSLTFWRMILPINEPAGYSKKYRNRLKQLTERTKDLVQRLNDNFSVDHRYSDSTNYNMDDNN